MSEPKVIWTGTYAGYAVDVRIVGGVPVQFLDGRRSMLPGDREGITNAATVGLAAERDAALAQLESMRAKRQDVIDGMTRAIEAEGRANKACAEMQLERDALRERLAKLEATLMSIRDTGVDPRLDVGDIVEGDARKAWQDWAKSVGAEGVGDVEA